MASREVFKLLVEADVSGGATAIRSFATGVRKDLGQASGDADSFGRNAVKLGAALTTAGAVGTAAFVALGFSAKAAASETLGLQRVAGGSAEAMSALRFAAQQTGVEITTLQTGFVRLAKAASSEKGADKLAAYGIAARDASGNVRQLPDLLNEVADAVSRLPNGGEKDDLVTTLFGKGGTALIPLLNRGSVGLAELADKAGKLGAVLDSKALDSTKRLTAAQRDLSGSVDALKVSLGQGVVPVLATANEALASVASTAAEAFASLPDGAKQAVGAVGILGSTALTTGGSILTAIGGAADGVLSLKEALSGVSFGKIAAGVGAVAAAAAAVGFVTAGVAEANDQSEKFVSTWVRAGKLTDAAFDPDTPGRYRVALQGIAEDLAKVNEVSGPRNNADRIGGPVAALFGIDNQGENRQDLADQTLESLKTQLASLSGAKAARVVADLEPLLESLGLTADETAGIIAKLKTNLDLPVAPPTGLEAWADAVEKAREPVVTLTDAIRGLQDGLDPGEMAVFGSAVESALGPLEAADAATQRFAKAQRDAARSAEKSAADIRNAYQRLADAKEDLDRILAGDGNNLEQESPEAQIARARAAVYEANAVLVNNPNDAAAQTKKDEGLADEQRGIERRQQLKRDAADQARQVKDAQRRIADAEQGVKDAQQRQSDAQESAQGEIDAAGLAVAKAVDAVAVGVENGTIKLDEVGAYLQTLVDRGLLPQSTVDDLLARYGDIVSAAGQVGPGLVAFAKKIAEATAIVPTPTTSGAYSMLGGFAPRVGEVATNLLTGSNKGADESKATKTAHWTGPKGERMSIAEAATLYGFDARRSTTDTDPLGRKWTYSAKASGGVGFAGSMYNVNEFGTESFRPAGRDFAIPLTTGTFLTAGQTRNAMNAATSSGGSAGDTFQIYEQRSPRLTAQAIVRERRASAFRRGRL